MSTVDDVVQRSSSSRTRQCTDGGWGWNQLNLLQLAGEGEPSPVEEKAALLFFTRFSTKTMKQSLPNIRINSLLSLLLILFTSFCLLLIFPDKNRAEQKEPLLSDQVKSGPAPIETSDREQKPKKANAKIPIAVIYQGSEAMGRKLAFALERQMVNSGLFFIATRANERQFKLTIQIREEFPGRPGLAWVYSLVWTFSYQEDVLPTYLDSTLGIIREDRADRVAEDIAAQTFELSKKFAYLLEEKI